MGSKTQKAIIQILEVKDNEESEEYYIAKANRKFEKLKGIKGIGEDPLDALLAFINELEALYEKDKKEQEIQ
jgi:endonuclease III-like uncharacterized protein